MLRFIQSSKALLSSLSRREGIMRFDQFRRFVSVSGYSHGLECKDAAANVSFGRLPIAGIITQRRRFHGYGDGEEDDSVLSKIYQERRLLGYSQEQLFDVIATVDLYHGFVPGCQRSEIVKEHQDGSFDAEIEVGCMFLVDSYTSHVEFQRPNWIKTTAKDTRFFEHLINVWQFKPGPVPGTCHLHFLVDYKFNSPFYRQVASMFLKEVESKLVGTFSDRCKVVYGPGIRVDDEA
uniref:Coenzyme Q-binding protein COQ10-like protein B, mitochondrial n=1 Tax=Noccaea caerulescens TaxID=107243 RepID=A0A1J3IR77_NOCCA